MITVDRNQFIAWTEGIFLDRNANHCLAVDEEACEKANKDLFEGKKIMLLINGRTFSYMEKQDDKFLESKI
jgi:hypothetical protein